MEDLFRWEGIGQSVLEFSSCLKVGEIRSGVREKEGGVELHSLNHSPLNEGPNRPEGAAETLEKPVECMVFFFPRKKMVGKKKKKESKTFPLLCILQKAQNVVKKRSK